jgi:hypothetical protein
MPLLLICTHIVSPFFFFESALVASEQKYKNECEDMTYKMEDLEAKQRLTEEDAEESAQLLAQAQRFANI